MLRCFTWTRIDFQRGSGAGTGATIASLFSSRFALPPPISPAAAAITGDACTLVSPPPPPVGLLRWPKTLGSFAGLVFVDLLLAASSTSATALGARRLFRFLGLLLLAPLPTAAAADFCLSATAATTAAGFFNGERRHVALDVGGFDRRRRRHGR
jgi:hypothetical protein